MVLSGYEEAFGTVCFLEEAACPRHLLAICGLAKVDPAAAEQCLQLLAGAMKKVKVVMAWPLLLEEC